jgi:hypothetical protein
MVSIVIQLWTPHARLQEVLKKYNRLNELKDKTGKRAFYPLFLVSPPPLT